MKLGGNHGWPYGITEREERDRLLAWVEMNGLDWQSGKNCFHYLLGNGHRGNNWPEEHRAWQSFDWMDHVSCWSQYGYRFLVAQPYSTVQRCAAEVATVAKFLGMQHSVSESGWYGHGAIIIVIGQGELKNLPA